MIERYEEFLKRISEEASILFDELCEQTSGENLKKYEALPEKEKVKISEMLIRLMSFKNICTFEHIQECKVRGLNIMYKEDKVSKIKSNEKESCRIELWSGMETFTLDSKKMGNRIFEEE